MKKGIFAAVAAFALLLCGSVTTEAQSAFKKGDKALNINYVLGGTGGAYSESMHGVMAMGEYGIVSLLKDRAAISVGAILGFQHWGEEYVSFNRIRIATRGTFHYSFTPKFDTYAGLNFLFVDIEKVTVEVLKEKISDSQVDLVPPALLIGARYMFTDRLGANVEFSWDDFQFISAGLTFKL